MMLPPKALTVLADLKRDLLAKQEVVNTPESKSARVEAERKVPMSKTFPGARTMRHARQRGMHFQRMCQRHDCGWGR